MSSNLIQGKCYRCGDNVDTDAVLPARYLNLSTREELGQHFMEDVEPGLAARIPEGSVLVAGKNFGCGSSREHAPVAVLGAGFACVIAESFSRLFFRNAINIGLPVLTVANASDIQDGATLTVDCESGTVRDETTGREYHANPLSGMILEILSDGGLIAHLQKKSAR